MKNAVLQRVLSYNISLLFCGVAETATDSTQISSGVGGKRTVFKSGDDLEDDFQDEGNAGPDTSERSDDDVDDKLGEPISLPKTAKSNTKDISKMLSSGKHKAGKYHPKVVKF